MNGVPADRWKTYAGLVLAIGMHLLVTATVWAQAKPADYFPIAQPNKRVYRVTDSSLPAGYSSVTRVNAHVIIGDHQYVKHVTIVDIPGREPTIEYMRVGTDGVHIIDGAAGDSEEYIAYPFPLDVGTTWNVQSTNYVTQNKVEAYETVDLPDRSYADCLKISYSGRFKNGSVYTGVQYWAPGVGFIKEIYRRDELVKEWRLETQELLGDWITEKLPPPTPPRVMTPDEQAIDHAWKLFRTYWIPCGETFVTRQKWQHPMMDWEKKIAYVQLKDVGIVASPRRENITDADRLNGIEWKGPLRLRFSAIREYKLGQG